MKRTVEATIAKAQIEGLIESVGRGDGDVIVEDGGKPIVAIIPISDYQRIPKPITQERRDEALAKLRALQERVRARNADLTAEDVEQLAKQVVDSAMASLIEKGMVRYED